MLAERIASQLGQRVLVIERRDHIGGNAYDFHNEHGLLVHKYGPHIFHTNSKEVWDYLSRFTEWRQYYHRVVAVVEGKKIPVPFNLNSLYMVFPARLAGKLERLLISEFGYGRRVPILRLMEHAKGDLRFLAQYVYENVFLGYTLKQWGMRPEELDPAVTGRVPVVISRDDRYFGDRYQAMPKPSYTAMFKRMLHHPNIRVLLNTDYREVQGEIRFKGLIYTGPIDEFFECQYGRLPYRSMRFEFVTHDVEWYQDAPTVNFPNEYDFTRITEMKYLSGQIHPRTVTVYEYPEGYEQGRNEPLYPVIRDDSQAQYALYQREAEMLEGKVLFAGRLGRYRYYNMDQAVASALKLFREHVASFA